MESATQTRPRAEPGRDGHRPTRRCSTEDNVERIIAGYDVILDGTDTFETRYTLNDAAVRAGIPVVHASVFRFEGQLTVFKPFEGPVLPLPLPHAAAAGAGARLLGGRRAGRRARRRWACSRPPRRSRCCSASATRWSGRLLIYDALDGAFQRAPAAARPALPGLRGRRPGASDVDGVFTLPAGPVGQLTTREVRA